MKNEIVGNTFIKYNGNESNICITGVTTIGDNCFENCYSINKITMSNYIESIGNNAFANCVNLENIKLSNSLKKIKSYCFYNCKKLRRIEIPSSLKELSKTSFSGCNLNLEVIYNDKIISAEKFYDYFINNKSKKVNIPIEKNIEPKEVISCMNNNQPSLNKNTFDEKHLDNIISMIFCMFDINARDLSLKILSGKSNSSDIYEKHLDNIINMLLEIYSAEELCYKILKKYVIENNNI